MSTSLFVKVVSYAKRAMFAVLPIVLVGLALPANAQSNPQTIQVTATNPDGNNTGTARLNVPVTLTANVSAGQYGVVAWSLQGAGTLNHIGGTNNVNATYTAPTTMPSNASVTITAYLKSNTAVTTPYAVTVVNPVPAVTTSSPAQLSTGATQTVSLVGSGFVPGTTISYKGSSLATTFTDYNHASVQVPVAANATGALSLQAVNPTPGGGAGTTFTESVAANSISLTASDQDGSNTGTAELGINVTMSATVSGSAQTAITWSLAGAGSITSGGVYTAPATMPSNNAVTITGALTSNPSVTASYPFNIINPVPVIGSASPAQVPSGTTTAVTLTGSGFISGTVLQFTGGTATTTYQSATSMTAQITVPVGATGNVSIQAQNATPGGGTSAAVQAAISTIQLTATNPDGTNTGTARLGAPVSFATAVSGSSYSVMAWTLQGAGNLNWSGSNNVTGLYTPPTTMPSSPNVVVIAYLKSNPSVTTSYPITLVNPVPTVSSSSPTQLNTGGTQPLALVGAGFVPGTTVLLNGSALATTFTDFNHATVQVPVAANASGSLSLQVQNPTPGGGAGTTFSEAIAGGSMTLSAVDSDGTNTGTAELGINVTMSASVSGSSQTAVNWSVTGAGSISSSGVYTAPVSMPSSSAVTITAALTSNTAVTASYQFTLINPIAVIGSASPASIPAGSAASVTLTGSGFVPGTVVLVNGTAVTTTYQSPTSVVARVSIAANQGTSVPLTAQNPSPGGGTSAAFAEAISQVITVTANNSDGTNTGSARLGTPVSLTAVVSPGQYSVTTWTLQGAGTLTNVMNGSSPSATYTPPTTMPTSNSVAVVVTLSSNSSVTTSYPITLVNPIPAVTSSSPAQLNTGGTQPLAMVGSGFVPGMTVALNGSSLATTFTDYNHASVQVPVAANASGSLNLQPINPTPGGGAGSAFSEAIAGGSISLTATDGDGTNTGTAELGINVTMSANVTGSSQTAVTWSSTGAGSISSAGVYTAPTTMPSSSAVTITATLTSNTAVTATYQLSLINPAPVLSGSNPAQVSPGATSTIVLTGTGFTPATTLTVSPGTVTTTYQSPTSVSAQVTEAAGASGNVSITAQNAGPGGGTSAAIQVTIGQTIQVAATNSDGTNTGSARLGAAVTLVATVAPGQYQNVAWSLTGPGTLSGIGGTNNVHATYTPPTTMPSTATATVTAYLKSNTAVTTSYPVAIVNPIPAVTSSSPAQVLTGGTQTLSMVGSGFVPGSVVAFNGNSLATTFTDFNHATVQVPVPANASGSISLQIQNPAPGGGAGTTFSQTVAANTITIAAVDQNGKATTAAALSSSDTLTATVSGSTQTVVNWSVTGGGSITSAGVYTAPASMPSNSAATVTATLASNSAITGTFQLSFGNPAPTITNASPSTVMAGATSAVTLTGSGFVPGTVILVNNTAATTTYQSATSVVVQVAVPSTQGTSTPLVAQNPTPGGGNSAAFAEAIGQVIQITATNADGTNTGTARLGVPVSLSATVSPGKYSVMSFSLSGAGALSNVMNTSTPTATYTAPTAMPSSATATITVYLTSNQAVTVSYPITIVNPIPVVSSSTPAQVLTGGTQSVTLVGSGFIPGTVVNFNGSTLQTTFTDYNHATVQLPVAANATGSLTLKPQNPTPVGGSGAAFSQAVATNSIMLSASDPDGSNPSNVELGDNVTMTPTVSGSAQTGINWSVTGGGSISSSGVYTAPSVMPSSTAVTITAALTSNTSITATYPFSLINPEPVITSGNPLQVTPGTTTSITLNGSGFVAGTVLSATNGTITATYQSPTSLVAQVTVASGVTGNVAIVAQNPSPGGGTSVAYQEAIAVPVSATMAARVLDQTTFGPTTSLIQHVQQEGINAWLTEQFNTATTVLPAVAVPTPSYCPIAAFCAESEWWQTVMTGNDQLRQRVALALNELFVISVDTVTGNAIPTYGNMLANDAFGNWYNIMNDVTLSPGMSVYLNMLNSAKAPAGQIANENFARENMQLFNLGLDLINQDGSLQLDSNNNPQPTYTEAQIEQFARVYTGWTYANADGSTPNSLIGTPNYLHPLVAVENYHDMTAKTLLNGTVLPAGQTAEQDLAGALTNIFNHPNLPPFVSKLLIQHLVTGNPSPAYVSRVAAAFIDDGSHVRGDMQAVLTAIFTDPEARAGDNDATVDGGHLREPILYLASVMRGLGYTNVDPNNYYYELSATTAKIGEAPFSSPSVFNFFPPGYVIPDVGINSPEFAMENTGSVTGRLTLADQLVSNDIPAFNVDLSATSPLGQLASNPSSLVAQLNLLFTHGQMDSNTISAVTSAISGLSDPAQRVRVAVYLVITSSEYKVMH